MAMKGRLREFFTAVAFILAPSVCGQDKQAGEPDTPAPPDGSSAVQVYGVTSEGLPVNRQVPTGLRSMKRYAHHQTSLDLPDAFYFIGTPIFMVLLLRVLAIFINLYEEERRRESKNRLVDRLEAE